MADDEVTGWVGWGWFAGIVLLIAGVFWMRKVVKIEV